MRLTPPQIEIIRRTTREILGADGVTAWDRHPELAECSMISFSSKSASILS